MSKLQKTKNLRRKSSSNKAVKHTVYLIKDYHVRGLIPHLFRVLEKLKREKGIERVGTEGVYLKKSKESKINKFLIEGLQEVGKLSLSAFIREILKEEPPRAEDYFTTLNKLSLTPVSYEIPPSVVAHSLNIAYLVSIVGTITSATRVSETGECPSRIYGMA
jgi:hypothetical protein